MGLMLSVLIGCVGVLELLACLRYVSGSSVVAIHTPTPCLSYHDPNNDNQSTHDSLCSISHSSRLNLPRSAKHKLENLHEYSLRVRSELRSLDRNFECGALSECSSRDFLASSRPDSRMSPEPSSLVHDDEKSWINDPIEIMPNESNESFKLEQEYHDDIVDVALTKYDLEKISISLTPASSEADKYVRVPTPVPFDLGKNEELVELNFSSDAESSDSESGNELPTTTSFDNTMMIKSHGSSSFNTDFFLGEYNRVGTSILKRPLARSVSESTDILSKFIDNSIRPESRSLIEQSQILENLTRSSSPKVESRDGEGRSTPRSQKKTKTSKTTILRKATRLKSKNTEISKSAEQLNTKKAKRHREPERRKSDISVQTIGDLLIDEWTNTSPPSSPSLSRSESKKSVSVEVQTSFEVKLSDDEAFEQFDNSVVGLAESKRDLSSRDRPGRKSFRSKRFGSSSSSSERYANDGKTISRDKVTSVVQETQRNEFFRVSGFEEAKQRDYDKIRGVLLERSEAQRSNERRRGEVVVSASSLEEDSEDYVDAEDVSPRAIEYTTPDTDENKAFWLIFSGEYTKAMNKDWHSGHFCCWQCDESLTGQRYVLRDEHPYCIKCYESVFANGCEECSKIIGIDSKDLSYKDKHWHEACFLCNRCRVSLVDKQFGSKVDKIYCGNCYDAQFASRCDGCGEIFRAGTKKMEYKTRQWHEKCFCCVVCKNPIGTKSFIPREQEIYCAGCYEDKFATRCVKCNKIITSGGVTYKNEPWHRDCFTCSHCNNSLAGQRFTSRDDKPYCADCFGELFAKRCTACSKPITGIGGTRFISFEDRHWHNDCFICAGCKTSLVGRGFITDADDIICPECAKMKLM